MCGSRYVYPKSTDVFGRPGVERELMAFLQTSLDKTGSDAMNAAGDYSSAYCILSTDSEFSGHGMVSRICVFFSCSWDGLGWLCGSEGVLRHSGPVQLRNWTRIIYLSHVDTKLLLHLDTFSPANLTFSRPSQSAAATKSSAPPSPTSPTASRAAPWTRSSPTGARHGATSSTTRSCAGSARRRASSTWPWAPWSTPSGTCGPRPWGNPCGASSRT